MLQEMCQIHVKTSGHGHPQAKVRTPETGRVPLTSPVGWFTRKISAMALGRPCALLWSPNRY